MNANSKHSLKTPMDKSIREEYGELVNQIV